MSPHSHKARSSFLHSNLSDGASPRSNLARNPTRVLFLLSLKITTRLEVIYKGQESPHQMMKFMGSTLLAEVGAIAQWVSVVAAGVVLLAVGAIARMLTGKANKSDVDQDFLTLRAENKVTADEGLRQYRELRTAIEGTQKEITALDKHSLTSTDLIEIKADIKEVIKGQREQVKLIDGMPERLTSLEATRNKQSEAK